MSNDWTFDNFGPEFEDHATGHLPHYHQAHQVIANVAHYVVPAGAIVADLGCSTGHAIHQIATAIAPRQIEPHGYDLDQSMLDIAAEQNDNFHPHRADLTRDALDHPPAHLTLCLWTLQFLPTETWTALLAQARQHAHPDGLLIVSAKTMYPDSRWQHIADGALTDWKLAHGVTPEAVTTKARQLRGTMTTKPTGRIAAHILEAGWDQPTTLYQWHNWAILAAWTTPPEH